MLGRSVFSQKREMIQICEMQEIGELAFFYFIYILCLSASLFAEAQLEEGDRAPRRPPPSTPAE